MTSTSKSAHIRDIAVGTGGNVYKAAKVFGTGYAGMGLQAATHGYSWAKRRKDRRSKKRAATARSSNGLFGTRTRRFVLLGTVFASAAGVAVMVAKRRQTLVQPAEAAPSLDDYTEVPTPVNGSSAHAAER